MHYIRGPVRPCVWYRGAGLLDMDQLEKLQKKISGALGGNIDFTVHIPPKKNNIQVIDVNTLSAYAGQNFTTPWEYSVYDGEKFPGGLGATQVQQIDYWTLRARSTVLYNQNIYARALINRLITNEINTGLTPEAIPDESILGFEDGELNDWTERVENRFSLWGKNPRLCDFKHRLTFGAIQRVAKIEAYVTGDILVVLRPSAATKLPMVQLISGNRVQTPMMENVNSIPKSHKIKHGIQFDGNDRIVAHWVKQDDGSIKRIPAFGEKSGRRISWLVYGSEKRLDDVRGQPLLSLVLQSLQDIDNYRDSTQRKALINSFFAASVEKSEDKPGTFPIQNGAIRNDVVNINNSDGKPRTLNIGKYIPGVVIDEMQTGEKINFHTGDGTDLNFSTFEETITAAIAWGNEIPPEIYRLTFSRNYAGSQAAVNEFKNYLNKIWSRWGEDFCTPIYTDVLISESLLGKNPLAADLLQSWRDNKRYDIFTAWTSVDWYGSVKPSTDILKQTKGSEMLVKNGWSTNARESRGLNGSKFTHNVKKLKQENTLLVEAWTPILEAKAKFGEQAVNSVMQQTSDAQSDNETDDEAVED